MRRLDREIAVLGSTSVGKSALTMRFVHNEFPTDYDPTIFKRYTVNTTTHNIEYNLGIFDTAGLEQQSQISHSFLRSNGFVLVYSIADAQSFAIVKDIYNRLADELMKENIPVVLVGNKSDLSEKRAVSADQGLELAKSINARFFETSARTGNNVRESFLTLLNIIDNHTNNNNNPNTNNANIDINDIRNSKEIDHQQQQQQQQQQGQRGQANNRTTTSAANSAKVGAGQDKKDKSNCVIS